MFFKEKTRVLNQLSRIKHRLQALVCGVKTLCHPLLAPEVIAMRVTIMLAVAAECIATKTVREKRVFAAISILKRLMNRSSQPE